MSFHIALARHRLCIVAWCLLGPGVSAGGQVEADANAANLVRETVSTYQMLSTYQDSGVLTEVSFPESNTGNGTTVITFKTKFHRGGDYSFAWTTTEHFAGKEISKSENRFWSDNLKGWWSESNNGRKPKVIEMSFDDATASATGISLGASHDIFRLLTKDLSGFRIDALENLRVKGTEIAEGTDSYILAGNYPKLPDMKCEVWIGKKDHLIRKWVEVDLYHHTTTTVRSDLVVEVSAP
jgi:hypothetical protein